jgi:hypothetical protein
MKKLLATIGATTALAFAGLGLAVPAQAGQYGPPLYGDHVTYYNCKGPFKNPYNYWSTTPYYQCYADWDWYAEWFWGKHDGQVTVAGWYYA